MLVAMVTIFAGCWMPLNCVHVTMEFSPLFTKQENFGTVFFIDHVIAMYLYNLSLKRFFFIFLSFILKIYIGQALFIIHFCIH